MSKRPKIRYWICIVTIILLLAGALIGSLYSKQLVAFLAGHRMAGAAVLIVLQTLCILFAAILAIHAGKIRRKHNVGQEEHVVRDYLGLYKYGSVESVVFNDPHDRRLVVLQAGHHFSVIQERYDFNMENWEHDGGVSILERREQVDELIEDWLGEK